MVCSQLSLSQHELANSLRPRPRSTVVRASARGAGGRGSIPDRVTLARDVKNGRFELLSVALGINELGI